MKKVYNVSVKLLSALHINGGADLSGVRVTVKSEGKAYIPATLFKGITRSNFEKIAGLFSGTGKCIGKDNPRSDCGCICCRMFGKSGFQRSRIIFDNLTTEQELTYSIRTNIAVNKHLLTARYGALVNIETVDVTDKSKNNIVFSGQITAFYPDDCAEQAEAFLIEAVEMIENIGFGKSRGLGFVEATISEADC